VSQAPVPGVHLTHKRVGESSFDVVRRFKSRAYEGGHKKLALGHGGTLDPFAEGLLLVLAGQATRLMELMHPLPKSYRAEITWGRETDTCDLLGLSVSEGDASSLSSEKLEAALNPFLGWQDQIPPATSAKKIDGEAAYKKAHRGEVFELRPSQVHLHEARWIDHDLPHHSVLEITCRGGFYVRSLARDLGRALGCGAHLSILHRTQIGPWLDPGVDKETLISGEALLPWCPTRRLSDLELDHLLHGRPIALGECEAPTCALPKGFPDPEAPIRAMHKDHLVALLNVRDGALWTFANLRGGI
jgi:tRNA pseudouridine55 synthase